MALLTSGEVSRNMKDSRNTILEVGIESDTFRTSIRNVTTRTRAFYIDTEKQIYIISKTQNKKNFHFF